ncbi:MAG: AAA family ATPase, partial [Acidobacteriota bacterium]
IHGVGFLTADRNAQAVGIAPHAPVRAAAGLHHRLQTAADVGHTLMPEAALCAETAAQLAVPEAAVRAGLVQLLDAAHAVRVDDAALLARDPATADGAPRIALCTLREAEHAVAARLATLAAGGSADDGAPPSHDAAIAAYQDDAGLTLDPGQRRALVRALDSRVLVITGGPGTGKTTLVRGIVHVLRRAGLRLHLAAPTGRAAKRLTEATGVEGRTLHRLLAWNPRLGAFAHDADAPLETDLVIVDEASMLDVVLTRCLLEALPDDARLILVGDVDQLPSVGPGRVLGDLIDSGAVPVERLTTIFRQAQASRIVTSAHRVRAGEMPEIDGPDARDPSRDFFFLHRARPEAVVETVLEIVKNRIPRRFDVDPRRDLQVLTPMRRGPLGTQALNEQLQRVLNPESGPTLARGGRELRAGDRVMQLRNNYDLDVYNGDIGRVRAVLPRKPPSSDDDKPPPRLLVDVDGRPVPYDDSALDDLTLAYASTIHKSQGSEFPFVVVVLHDQHFIMLQRNLLYTAITRGRRFVVVVGSRRALQRAVRTREASRRQTLLTAQLRAATETGGGAG